MSNCNTTIVSRLMAINKLEIEAEKQRKRMLKTYKYSESPSLKKTTPLESAVAGDEIAKRQRTQIEIEQVPLFGKALALS